MKTLVTGGGGFIGKWLVKNLEKNYQTHYISRKELHDNGHGHLGDILDKEFIKKTISDVKPDFIYHLAAQSFPQISWISPRETFEVNILGTLNILESVDELSLKPRIINFGSSAEYAFGVDNQKISENHILGPNSPYGVSKMAQSKLVDVYCRKTNIDFITVRPFFVIGPGKTNDFCSTIANKISAVENGDLGEINVGNLDSIRDFLDIQDCINALEFITGNWKSGEEYNICSGEGIKIREALNIMSSYSKSEIKIRIDPKLLRPHESSYVVGDPSKLQKLGWKKNIKIEDTLKNILNEKREIY